MIIKINYQSPLTDDNQCISRNSKLTINMKDLLHDCFSNNKIGITPYTVSLEILPVFKEFGFGGGISGQCCCLSLEVLEQSHEFTNLQGIKLAAC